METGLLNFHDEETFTNSIYDQGDLSGVDGQSSLLDMMHSDLQYSSDYINQSAVHWDSDQEQEHNGDIAVLPVAPSECSSINSSREDYQKVFFEWQDNPFSYQPLDPDVVDLRLDSQVIPEELPDNIFEDSYESNLSTSSTTHKPSTSTLLTPPPRCSTPNLSEKEKTAQSDGSLNLDMSLSGLDVNVSDIDVSALGINVSSLDIKTESTENVESKVHPLTLDPPGKLTPVQQAIKPESCVSNSDEYLIKEELLDPLENDKTTEQPTDNDFEFASLFEIPEGNHLFQSNPKHESLLASLPVRVNNSEISVPKLENADVDQPYDIAMEFIKEEQEAQDWKSLPLLNAPLDCNIDMESINGEVPVLEAGNLESLLEQFEATLKPAPDFSQSMPASPLHFSVPPSPLSMPASPSCVNMSQPLLNQVTNPPTLKTSPGSSPVPSPSNQKTIVNTPNKGTLSKGVSVLHQNVLEKLTSEVKERAKASNHKKTISLIPAMPSKRANKSSTRMHAAGAALSRNKLLKLVSQKGTTGEAVQFDHDYCSNNDSSSVVEFVPEKLVMDIKASTKQMELDDDKNSRKDSGLESGDVSEDSEGAIIPSGASSGCETGTTSSKSYCNTKSVLKPRVLNQPGRSKEMLMVSVLKKVRCDTSKSVSSQPGTVHRSPDVSKTVNISVVKPAAESTKSIKVLSKPNKASVKLPASHVKIVEPVFNPKPVKPMESPITTIVDSFNSLTSDVKLCEATVNVKSILKSDDICSKPIETSEVADHISAKPPEQPKKRKLNLEEYRNRQRAIEKERENKITPSTLNKELLTPKEAVPEEKIPADSTTKSIAEENSNISEEIKEVKIEHAAESLNETMKEDVDPDPEPTEEKRRQRQYRTRHLSTSSSEGSPQTKVVCKSSNNRKNWQRKPVTSKSRSRSQSASSSSSRSRSASSHSSRSSSSSSSGSSSSSSSGSSRSSRSSRSRRRSRSSSRSTSRSSRRSNSISCGSSRHSSRRSKYGSGSRSRSRSSRSQRPHRPQRPHRRSRRDRSRSTRSTSRGRGRSNSWRRWGRGSSRDRRSGSFRRGRSRARNGRRKSGSSSLSWSRSRSRSYSSQRHLQSRSRSRSRLRFNSCSSRSESWSRSGSRARFHYSRSRSCSSGSDRLYNKSRSRSDHRQRTRTSEQRRAGSYCKRIKKNSWRSRSPMRRNVDWTHVEKEHNRQVEERRVIYVGRIPEDTTKAELRRRFEVFGPIVDINLHFREHADNYGFVTFAYQVDAYEAVERGNDDPTQPNYELCFGGRRKFCRERYADLDGLACKSTMGNIPQPHMSRTNEKNSFDDMLREVQAKLQARKKL